MIINQQQHIELCLAAKPLREWLKHNCHPHCEIRVDMNTIELLEGIALSHETN